MTTKKSPFTEAACVSLRVTKAFKVTGHSGVYETLWQAQKAAMIAEFTALLGHAWPEGVQVDHRVLDGLALGLTNRSKQVAGILAIAHAEPEGE